MLQLEAVVDQWIGALTGVVTVVVDLGVVEPRIDDERVATRGTARQLVVAVAVTAVDRADGTGLAFTDAAVGRKLGRWSGQAAYLSWALGAC